MKKSQKRLKAENDWINILNVVDPSGFNAKIYRNTFDSMSDKEFDNYMKRILSEEEFVILEIDSLPNNKNEKLSMEKIFKIAKQLGVKTHKYVIYRENSNDDNDVTVSKTPVPILYIPVKRLQQMLSKKNSAASNIEKTNPITGTVTSDSKAASISDNQTYGLITTSQHNTLKELMGPRADDSKSKDQMIRIIEDDGKCRLSELHINKNNKQGLRTTKVLLRMVGLKMEVK